MKCSFSEFNYLFFNIQKSEIDLDQIVTTLEDYAGQIRENMRTDAALDFVIGSRFVNSSSLGEVRNISQEQNYIDESSMEKDLRFRPYCFYFRELKAISDISLIISRKISVLLSKSSSS
jgi:hypothetical protein